MRQARTGRRPVDAAPPTTSARLVALRLLGRREYSTSELTRKLTDRGYDADEIERVVATLLEERVLDDRRVAEAHVRTASRIKGRGAVRIRRELEARGIASSLVHEVTAALSTDDQLTAIAGVIARKGGGKPLDPALRRRLFLHLLRRGFAADLVSKAMKYKPQDED
jgi:regulatory protein